MYYTHNLRTNLQEWRNRLYRSTYQNFDNSYRFFMTKLDSIPVFRAILNQAVINNPISEDSFKDHAENLQYGNSTFSFKNEEDGAAACYQFLKYIAIECNNDPSAMYQNYARGDNFNEQIEAFIQNFVDPIVNYVHDQIDNTNSVLYLLEKYKSRVEWFVRGTLLKQYKGNTAETLLEDDLRLFLFDQGIDYPFSTPRSASGRADIVSLIDTDDPLVLEIKIYDTERGYRKNKIISGFSQIVKYSNDYNQSVGYLVVFNIDNVEIDIEAENEQKQHPKAVVFNGKTYFIIIVNLNQDVTASKQGKLKVEKISTQELTQKIEDPEVGS